MERLQKILAHAGIASRRKCEELILARRVRVNGEIAAELGTKVDPARDRIQVDGETIRVEKKHYVILNKPRGYISDCDPGEQSLRGKRSALELVQINERLYPAGRLDANSEGLLLLTNDGALAHRITHPRFEHQKEYLALVEGAPKASSLEKLRKGIELDGEFLRADRVGLAARHQRFGTATLAQSWLKIILHEGKKRQVRRMCAAVGHPVLRLIRTRIGSIELGALAPGEWRALNEKQIQELIRPTKHMRRERDHRN